MSEISGAMEPMILPPVGLKSTYCATPNNGVLYLGSRYQQVIYIAAPDAQRMFPKFKVILAPAKIFFECLAVDPVWEEHRQEFTVVSDRFKIFVLDVKSPVTLKSHSIHQLTDRKSKKLPTQFALCYTHNRHILSVDRQTFVNFDVDANTYTSYTTGWFVKHNVKTMTASPFNTDLFAAGTKSGLVLIVTLKNMAVVHQMRGHETEIKCLSWTMLRQAVTCRNDKLKAAGKHSVKQEASGAADSQTDDDMFDIYSYDHLENEFGTYTGDQPDLNSDDESKMPNNVDIVEGNEKFDFVEACSNLKDMILQTDDTVAPVTTADIDELCTKVESILDESATSINDTSFKTVIPAGSSDVVASNVSCASSSSGTVSRAEEIGAVNRIVLVSLCNKSLAWVWDSEKGEAMEKFKPARLRQADRSTAKMTWITNEILLSSTDRFQLWKFGFSDANRLTIKEIIRDFIPKEHEQIVVQQDSPPLNGPRYNIWMQHVGLRCIETNGDESRNVLALATSATEVQAIEVNQLESNLVAVTSFKQILVLNMSKISANFIDTGISIIANIKSAVYALAWHPEKAHVLAFSTKEGQIGIVNINKPAQVVYMKPKFTCTVYSLTWGKVCDHNTKVPTIVLMCCANREIVYFMGSGDHKHEALPMQFNGNDPKHIKAVDRYLFIGTDRGFFSVCDLQDNKKFIFGRLLGKKYISSIDVHEKKVVVATMCGKVELLDIEEICTNASIEDVKVTTFAGHTDGVVSVRFSPDGSKIVSTSYDCTVRVWDTNDATSCQVFHFPCFIYAAVFSALNPNIVVCGGIHSGTLLIDITSETKDLRPFYCNIDQLKPSRAIIGGSEVSTEVEGGSAVEKTNKRSRRNRGGGAEVKSDMVAEESTMEGAVVGHDEARPAIVEVEQPTILYLCSKEMNREPLNVLKRCIEPPSNEVDGLAQRKLYNEQFFSTRDCLRMLLDKELQNSKQSATKSTGNLLLPQITGHLKEEILLRLTTKTMTDEYLALAPNVSYVFWRDCCRAYGLQLIEKGLILKAITYLWSSNDINETIQQLCTANFYREAYCVAKLRKEDGDPIFNDILTKWSQQYENHGALEAAATIACVNRQFANAKSILEKRRVLTAEHEEVLGMLVKLI